MGYVGEWIFDPEKNPYGIVQSKSLGFFTENFCMMDLSIIIVNSYWDYWSPFWGIILMEKVKRFKI